MKEKIDTTKLQINSKGKQYKTGFRTGTHKSAKDYNRKKAKDKLKKDMREENY